MKIKVNGWQRLWILLGILYLIIVIFCTISLWPSKKGIFKEWRLATINIVKGDNEYSYKIREQYNDIPDKELIVRIQKEYAPKYITSDFQTKIASVKGKAIRLTDLLEWAKAEKIVKINIKYQNKIDSLFINQLKTIGLALACWVIPLLVLYAFGLGITWVIGGFKENKNL